MKVREHDGRRGQVGASHGGAQVGQRPLSRGYLLAVEHPGVRAARAVGVPGNERDIHVVLRGHQAGRARATYRRGRGGLLTPLP